MICTRTSSRQSEQGFTLVELAIVMVIIGLLIGGILKGQELIANAKVSSTVSQLKGLDAALNTFQDKYNALAGDMNNTQNRLPGGIAGENGNNNGTIDPAAGAAAALNEGSYAFAHLTRADLVSGVNIANGAVAGGLLPQVKAGGVMWLGTAGANGAAAGLPAATLSANRLYASLNGSAAAVAGAGATGGLTPVAAAQIDRKLDDGIANTGSTQSTCGGGVVNAQGNYNENITNVSCSMYVRVNN